MEKYTNFHIQFGFCGICKHSFNLNAIIVQPVFDMIALCYQLNGWRL